MSKFLKIIGSGRNPCPEPYNSGFVDFSDWRNPAGKIEIGDQLLLYAAGGRKSVFAKGVVTSGAYPSGREGWPHRMDIQYEINLLPEDGVPIREVSLDRNLGVSVLRQSYIALSESEFSRASQLLEQALEGGAVDQAAPVRSQRFFTTYWRNKTWRASARSLPGGSLLDHAASDQFRDRGVSVGDAVYVVTIKKGRLFVASKMVVGALCSTSEAQERLGTTDLWAADQHIIASRSTPVDWDLEVPSDITAGLRFLDVNGIPLPLIFESPGALDKQTLRGVRRLSPDSAVTIDKLLPPLSAIPTLWSPSADSEHDRWDSDFESFAEGTRKTKYVTYYERDPKNRIEAIRIHGYECKGCGMHFERMYGSHGKDFIHVHHVKPVAQFEKPRKIDPKVDLTVLCANCHAMVHRNKDKTLSVEELKKLIAATS